MQRRNWYLFDNSTQKEFNSNFIPYKNMTVCIACLADNGKGLVLAADNKTTHNLGNGIEYENENDYHKKIYRFSDNIFVLAAGTNNGEDIIVRSGIEENDTIEIASEKIRRGYENYQKDLRLKRILIPNGFSDWNDFLERQHRLHQTMAYDIQTKLNYAIGDCSFIIAVRDKKTMESSVYSVSPDALIHNHTGYGFAVIGIGSAIASFSLLKSKYKKSLPLEEVIKITKEAMEDASHSPGVGKLGELISLPLHQ
jgi:20S proteasome alpha/beta subunit